MTSITEPGIYDGLPAEVYHSDPVPGGSLSSSGARRLLNCPLKFAEGEEKTTSAMERGTAAHTRVLGAGPDLHVIEADNWRKDATKQEAEEARLAGKIPVLAAQAAKINGMVLALQQHRAARELLTPGSGLPEQSLFWKDERWDIWRRSRIDFLPFGANGLCIIADYKLLALDTPLPTPDGWTTMGAVAVGDRVFAADGRPCTVTGKSAVQWPDCYRIRFDDKSEVICGGEHLWETTSGRNSTRSQTRTGVRSTEEIRRTLKLYGQCQHRIRLAGPLQLPKAKLPVDPALLGYWLANGTRGSGRVTCHADDAAGVIAMAGAAGYRIGAVRTRPGKKATDIGVLGLARHLADLGVSGHRHIPAAYLRASAGQRLALLRGLLDGDGSWNTTRQQAVFSSTSKELALNTRELALSLGQRAALHTVDAYGFGKDITAYQVTFTPLGGLVPFSLPRKAKQVLVTKTHIRSSRRVIQAVEPVLTVAAQCITVDSPDSTYLCGEAMIPTHNTSENASRSAMSRSANRYGYHLQADWYCEAVETLRPGVEARFALIVQETELPYAVACYYFDGPAMAQAHRRNQRACEMYRDCKESGKWPGYDPAEGIQPLSLPGYAYYDEEWDR